MLFDAGLDKRFPKSVWSVCCLLVNSLRHGDGVKYHVRQILRRHDDDDDDDDDDDNDNNSSAVASSTNVT
jgi:hypothetical protein